MQVVLAKAGALSTGGALADGALADGLRAGGGFAGRRRADGGFAGRRRAAAPTQDRGDRVAVHIYNGYHTLSFQVAAGPGECSPGPVFVHGSAEQNASVEKIS